MSGRSSRTVGLVGGALVSFVLALVASRWAAKYLGAKTAASASRVCRYLGPHFAPKPPSTLPLVEPIDTNQQQTGSVEISRGSPKAVSRVVRKATSKRRLAVSFDLKPTGGIRVRRAVVRAAARAGLRPSARFVPATARHPAGLLVTGWQSAGAGLLDGDIIVRVGGIQPKSVGQVIGAVIGAYEHKTYAVSGLIWRGNRALSVFVELPKPRRPRSSPASSASRPSSSRHSRKTPK